MSEKTNSDNILELHQLTYQFPYVDTPIIKNLNFTLQKGDRIGISAPNGTGKTTLFSLIMGILKLNSGSITVCGRPILKENDFDWVREKIGLLFQDSDDQLFCPTVLEDVAFGPLNQGKKRNEALAIARETLHLLGLDKFEQRVTHHLSGGEKRLVALATILSMKPEILLLDEPSTGLDEKTKKRLIEVLSKLDISYIIISHDHQFLSAITNGTYIMNNGTLYRHPSPHPVQPVQPLF